MGLPSIGWYDQLAQQFGNTVGGALSNVANMANDWYNQPLVTGMSEQQTNLLNTAGQQAGSWQPGVNAAATQAQTASNYNPAQLQQFMNPYTNDVMNTIQQRGNQNLSENVLPQVNATFTGSGQFGSSRNTDFMNRALRDNQQAISQAQGQAMNQAYGQASNAYNQWGQLGLQGAQQMGGLAQMGANLGWNDITNQWGLQEGARGIGNEVLGAGYKDWLAQLQTPYTLMQGLGGLMPNITSLYQGAGTSSSSSSGGGSSTGASATPQWAAFATPTSPNTMPPWLAALTGGLATQGGG